MRFDCPVCKHSEVRYVIDPVVVVERNKTLEYYVYSCENCNNVYCYEILEKPNIEGVE